jgi:glycosyltransferase involved in cell wall biosynthesis
MTRLPKKILYIQHASSLGGSCMSLLYTMQGLDETRYQPILALANDSKPVIDFYKAAGFEVITCPGITFWNHTTAGYRPLYQPANWIDIIKVIRSWKIGKQKTLELVKSVNPDLVHLNSVVLSASAETLIQKKIPFMWHIREPSPKEFLGTRTGIIRRLMFRCPELIFISKTDQQAWVGGRHGQVIHNFVDFKQFDRSIDGTIVRKKLGIPVDAPVMLYLGGLNRIKGIFPLLKALSILEKRLPQMRCLMPGSKYNPPDYWQLNLARKILPLIGSGTVGQRIERDIIKFGLKTTCICLPFQNNIASIIAASDVLVFPSTKPHFARPVIEAGAMAKPVVASRFGEIEELVQDGKTGLLIEPNNPEPLADALFDILTNKEKARQMGEAGYAYAKEKFSAKQNCEKIMTIYDWILNKES